MRKVLHSILLPALLLVVVLPSCIRRDLWVYTDEYRQVELFTDWSLCPQRPDGMTAWFISNDNDERNRHITTSDVDHCWMNLPRGVFTGIVFDWSPAEYPNQEFSGMTRPETAQVHVRAADPQPAEGEDLYGSRAIPAGMDIPFVDSTGLYQLSVTPDPMCIDTLQNVEIITGVEGDLVKWKDREEYEASLVTQTFHAEPRPVTWDLRILVHVKGWEYLHSMEGTVAGLAEGTLLSTLRHTSSVCLHAVDDWTLMRQNDSLGVIRAHLHTFGLPESTATRAGVDATEIPPLRLNLRILLRDEETVLYYHFDIIPDWVDLRQEQLEVSVEIPIWIELPYVDAKGSAGFNATVTPWADGGKADVTF